MDHRTPLRDAILGKAGRYGDLGMPYIIAVNDLDLIDDIDIMDALFGQEQYTCFYSDENPKAPVFTQMSRIPNGAWVSPYGKRNTRVSGVLVVSRFRAWNTPRASVRLYHNPWAAMPYRSALTRLPQAIPCDGHMEMITGELVADLLQLSETWPEG